MPILIKRTGLEQFAPGGNARVKVLCIGGPGTGKTRWASYFDRPFYIDCEAGLASVADRNVAFASITNSTDMNDTLQYLKVETRKPDDQREYNTAIVDTLDAYSRKVKNEWMERNRTDQFTGFEAWGYLGTRMQVLMTRLLNLDMNIIVNVHYKDKVTRDDDTKRETHEYMLQLQGEIADTAFNDFDLVGWLENEWASVEGKRELVRYITFSPTPQKPFLKDRLHLGDDRIPVTFADSDYTDLLARVTSKLDGLSTGGQVGEIPSFDEAAAPGVVTVENTPPATLPPRQVREAPLDTLDKATLARIAKEEGVERGSDGKPLRGNALKSELVHAINWHREEARRSSPPVVRPPAPPAAAPAAAPYRENVVADTVRPPQPTIRTPQGMVNPATGEILTAPKAEPVKAKTAEDMLLDLKADYTRAAEAGDDTAMNTAESALDAFAVAHPDVSATAAQKTVESALGATAIATTAERPRPVVAPVAPTKPAAPPKSCEVCGKDLASQNQQYVKLAWIKFRKDLCHDDFQQLVAKRSGTP